MVQGEMIFGAEFTGPEVAEWHKRIAARYGIASDGLVRYGNDVIRVSGEVLAVPGDGIVLVQPANGEPLAVRIEGDISAFATGRPVSMSGVRRGEYEYSVASRARRKAVLFLPVMALAFDRFVTLLTEQPDHEAFAEMRAVADSRLKTAQATADLQASEELRRRNESDPEWQKKHLITRGNKGPAILPRDPLVKDVKNFAK